MPNTNSSDTNSSNTNSNMTTPHIPNPNITNPNITNMNNNNSNNTNTTTNNADDFDYEAFLCGLSGEATTDVNMNLPEKMKWFDLCTKSNLGCMEGRVIPDSYGRIIREIEWFGTASYPFTEKGKESRQKIFWMGSENYKRSKTGLSPEQETKNNRLGHLIYRANNIRIANFNTSNAIVRQCMRKLWITYIPKCFVLFMKVLKSTPDSATGFFFSPRAKSGHTSYLVHRGQEFKRTFGDVIKNKITEEGNNDWLSNCFSRNGDNYGYITRIKTWLADKYEVGISISDAGRKKVYLNQSDLDLTRDLTKVYLSDVFDEATVDENIEYMEKVINDLSRLPELKMELEDEREELEF